MGDRKRQVAAYYTMRCGWTAPQDGETLEVLDRESNSDWPLIH